MRTGCAEFGLERTGRLHGRHPPNRGCTVLRVVQRSVHRYDLLVRVLYRHCLTWQSLVDLCLMVWDFGIIGMPFSFYRVSGLTSSRH